MTPYIDSYRGADSEHGRSWADHFRALFTWRYGADRADDIMTGRDPATEADIARWRRLGGRSAA